MSRNLLTQLTAAAVPDSFLSQSVTNGLIDEEPGDGEAHGV